jgi:hypothetical protein
LAGRLRWDRVSDWSRDDTASPNSRQRVLRAAADHLPLFLGERGVDVQQEGIGVGAQSGDSSVAPGSQAEDNRSESYIDEKLTISTFEIKKLVCFPDASQGQFLGNVLLLRL